MYFLAHLKNVFIILPFFKPESGEAAPPAEAAPVDATPPAEVAPES